MPALVGVPTNVTIASGDRSVLLGWSLVSGAQGYRIEWESDHELLVPVATGVLDHTGLTNNRIYNYVTSGNGPADVFAVPKAPPSGAPIDVTVTPGAFDNALSWAEVAGAAEYRIYWDYRPGVTTTTRRIDAGNRTSYLHQNLEAGASYHYTVTAVSATGKESAASPEVGGRAGAATGVSVTAGNGYAKLMGLSAGSSVTFTTSSTFSASADPGFPITFAELANGQRYTFRVTPRFAQGLGRPSTPVSATIKPPSTSAPQRVTLTAGRGVNHLRWNRVTGATVYTVTWSPADSNGTSTAAVRDPGPYETPRFRHLLPTPTCTLTVDRCPTYTYSVSADVPNPDPPVEVAAVSIDLRPFPPLVTDNPFVILTGLKPAGSLVTLNDVTIVAPSRDTAWEYTIDLELQSGPLRLVAVDEEGRTSAEAIYQMTLDREAPAPPTNVTMSCSPTTSGRRITLTGSKAVDSAIFMILEPLAENRLLVSLDQNTAWTAVVDVAADTDSITVAAGDAAGNLSSGTLATCPVN